MTETKKWKDIKHKKDHKALPPMNGVLQCNRGHQWSVFDLNPERKVVLCPACGAPTDIKKGLQREQS